MKIKADFHIHTRSSHDSSIGIPELISRAREKGLAAIAVTDHNTTKGALEARAMAGGNPLVLIGQEVMTKSGEIIVIGPEKDIEKGLSLEEACRKARELGGFIIAPHPFDRTRNGIGRSMGGVIESIDAMETVNSRCLFSSANRKAEEFAALNELPMVAGSDAHLPEEIGSSFTEVELEGKLSEKAILEAIVSGRTKAVGGSSGLMPHLRSSASRIFRL